MSTRASTNHGKFPPAPKSMPPAQRSHWNATVRSFPSDWFRAADLPILTEMVRAHTMADELAGRIAKTKDLAELKTLLQLRDAESRRAASLATKLRLPPQSRSDRHLAGAAARFVRGTHKPWDTEEPDDGDGFFDDD